MIAYLKGIIGVLTPTQAVLECAGVGYDVQITLPTYTQLQTHPAQEPVRLWIEEILREDAHDLYGFLTEAERTFFRKLTTVSGVGPNTARLILSACAVDELAQVIQDGNADRLKMIKGIGMKTAQRIIVDLKGKVELPIGNVAAAVGGAPAGQVAQEATQALKMLGYAEPQIRKALSSLLKGNPTLTLEELIKQALQIL